MRLTLPLQRPDRLPFAVVDQEIVLEIAEEPSAGDGRAATSRRP